MGDAAYAARPLLKKLLNKTNQQGESALHKALTAGSFKIVPLLLSEQKLFRDEPFIVQVVRQNKHKILKVMSDVVRFGYSELAKGIDYTPAEVGACKAALHYIQKSEANHVPKGADLL